MLPLLLTMFAMAMPPAFADDRDIGNSEPGRSPDAGKSEVGSEIGDEPDGETAARASATSTAESVCPRAEDGLVVPSRQRFVQSRFLADFDEALVSHGVLELNDREIVWRVFDPIEVAIILGKNGNFQSIDGGEPEPLPDLGASGNALLGRAGIEALLRGDTRSLDRFYTLSRERTDKGHWRITLTPREDTSSASVQPERIELRHCERLLEIRVEQAGGDRLLIEFED
ncbi:MAG: hypothetical protein CSB44_01885 [Gammaproteobacteria bacterium]|nr:MAG: hypothetical protein CSB44_01885 [Gammaproteobacteria bacterium]